MLSSQLTSVSQTATSPLILCGSLSASTNLLRSSGSVTNQSRHNQQSRAFRLGGYWSSYLEPGSEKDMERRHKILKYKYIEALNRGPSWEHKSSSFMKHFGKNFGCSSWRSHDAKPGGGWNHLEQCINSRDEGKSNSKDRVLDEDISDKHNLNSFMRSKTIYYSPADSKSTLRDMEFVKDKESMESLLAYLRNLRKDQSLKPESNKEVNEEYDIDPITNRKVFKKGDAVSIPVQKFEGYRRHFQGLVPPETDTTQADIDKYNTPFMYNEPDGKLPEKPDQVHESLKDYDEDTSYGFFRHNEPDGKMPEKPDSVQESLKEYDGEGYKPCYHNEPDGQPPRTSDPVQEGLKDYDECTSYNAFRYREPDGKLPEKPDPIQESLKDYDETTSYGSFRYNEPDGKFPPKPDPCRESLKDYDGDTSYGFFRHNEPDGKLPEKPDSCRESLKDYDTHTSYGSFRYNEPNGKFPEKPDSVRESLKDYNGNTAYGAFRYNEPDGKFSEKPDSAREALKEYNGNNTYGSFRYNEPDGKIPEKPDSARDSSKDYDQKHARTIQTSGSKPKAPEKTSQQFQKFSQRYPDEDTREDLDLLRASDIRAASGIIKAPKKETPEEKSAKRQQLEKAFEEAHQNVVEYAREIAAEQKSKGQTETKLRSVTEEVAGARENKDQKTYAGEADNRKATGNFIRDFPEEFKTSWTQQNNVTGALTPKVSKDAWGYDKSPKGLELSYSREVEQAVQKAEKEYIDGLGSNESFSRNSNTPRLQTSLDRINPRSTSPRSSVTEAKTEVDAYSKVPQGLETSYGDECAKQNEKDSLVYASSYGKPRKQFGKDKDLVREIRGIYQDSYGKIDSKHRQSPVNDDKTKTIPGEVPATGPEPTTYKVLAYDSTMQSINIAETTSIVTDNAPALTPADVLLRLSNPAKFFPHFQPLQAEGYEIVSGGGDVLVFRKVRPARRLSQADLKNSTTNPIDGMQVATGRFASPTGFVNHEMPGSAEAPFKSNIDVRREEPVFSGRSTWEDTTEAKRKKSGKTKRVLLGGAIVGSGCYAIGVVSEFFRTGGVDGKGAVGF